VSAVKVKLMYIGSEGI